VAAENGDLHEPVAERLVVDVAAVVAEDDRRAVSARLRLHCLLHGGRDQVVGDGRGDLLGEKCLGVGFGDVDTFAGGLAEEVLEELDEHAWVLGGVAGCRCLWRSAGGRCGVLLCRREA
jgi:hypothetical protein